MIQQVERGSSVDSIFGLSTVIRISWATEQHEALGADVAPRHCFDLLLSG